MKKKVRKQKGEARCMDCGWRYSNPINVNALAALHAQKKQHKVIFSLTISGNYNGRKVKDENKES
ncbi:MAG: hypothetical protein KGY74_10215 [Candidatus Cloacimonetes bacterium]|nr:hypothetical protein [Candidatus Cloacimonadota bacterium]